MNRERLLRVAKALRESPNPEKFTMCRYTHPCGTPACALGHYASREDLQGILRITRTGAVQYAGEGLSVDLTDYDLQDHFDLAEGQLVELFDQDGCDNASTAVEAAEYIERFVAEHGGDQ